MLQYIVVNKMKKYNIIYKKIIINILMCVLYSVYAYMYIDI